MVASTFKVLICLYFWQSESKNWLMLAQMALCFAILSGAITFFFLPESPRFLASKGRATEAVEVLKSIQRRNSTADKDVELHPALLICTADCIQESPDRPHEVDMDIEDDADV